MKKILLQLIPCMLLFIFFVILFAIQPLCAQFYTFTDYHEPASEENLPPEIEGQPLLSEYGLAHTPKGSLKILLVFVQFEGDEYIDLTQVWEQDTLPNYDEVLYTDTTDFNLNKTDLSISNFFYQMSRFSDNPFKVYGEMLPAVITIPQPTYSSRWRDLTNNAFDTLEAKYGKTINWNEYNKRTNKPYFVYNNSSSAPDDKIDYVMVSFRWNGGLDPWGTNLSDTVLQHILKTERGGLSTGWATIPIQRILTNTGYIRAREGFTTAKGLMNPAGFREFFYHEFAHALYDAPHYNGANSVVGEHFYSNTGWGMMGSGARHKSCALGWEQWWLGWNNITYDINSATQNQTFTLHGFIETGDMMRIKIPNTNQYLWLEFHTGNSVFEKRSTLIESNNYHYPETANGVLAYVECHSPSKSEPKIMETAGGGIKYLHGAGNFDYVASNTTENAPEWFNKPLYNFTFAEPNPFVMQNGVAGIRTDYGPVNDGVIKHSNHWNSPGPYGGNEMQPVMKTNGTVTYDAFGKNMNLKVGESYSIASNPAIVEHQYFYSPESKDQYGRDFEYTYPNDSLSAIRLHGLRITIVEQTNELARIKVEYNYNKVDKDTRWTGNIELPENQHLTLTGSDVVIDRSGTPARETPHPEYGFYPYSYLALKNGSKLDISNYSNLHIKEKTTLNFESGSDINVYQSTLNLDAGCEMVFNTGTYEINNTGTLNLNGALTLKANAHVTIKGSGITVLNGAINAEPGATLTFEGTSENTPLLQVEKSITFDGDLASVNILNGKVIMTNSSSEINLESGINNINLDNILVTTSSNTYNGHKGFDIRSNNAVTISNCTFKYGYYGVFASRSATAPNLVINGSTFSNCDYGLRTYNSGVTIDGCTFTYNTNKGIYCYGMDKSSSIKNSNISYQSGSGDYGLYYYGASTASLYLYANNIKSNYYGAYLNGSFVANARCNSFNHNTNYGLSIYSTDLYVANLYGITAGYNEFYSNLYAIQANGGGAYFYLKDGYNDFRSDSKCMTGTVDGITGGTVLADNNYWKNGGGAPTQSTDYVLYGSSTAITLSDNSPESSYAICSNTGGQKSMLLNQTETYNYRDIITSYTKAPLDQMVELILNTEVNKGVVFNADTRFKLLSELFANNLEDLNKGEAWYIKHAYNMYKASFSAFELKTNETADNKQNTNKLIKTIAKLEKDKGKNTKGGTKFDLKYAKLSTDQVYSLWYNMEYDAALQMVKSLMPKANEQQRCELERIACEINADIAFIESNNKLDIDELLNNCVCNDNGSRKIGSIIESGGSNNTNKNCNEVKVTIVPHPVNKNSHIQVKGLTDNGELIIYNSLGKVVLKQNIEPEMSTFEISNKQLHSGIYLVTVNANGKMLKSTKMVVTE